tara:strand:- start:262 stop:684 length:423 start_codon:yes stop_codon:yes gene_type:complete
MDTLIVERKLDSLHRCLARVRLKCPPDITTLANDADLQDVIVLNLSRAVQLCVDLGAHLVSGLNQPPPNTMGEVFDRMAVAQLIDEKLADRMKKSVGFRNMAVHNYDALDWAIVHAIATRHMSDFNEFASAISRNIATGS